MIQCEGQLSFMDLLTATTNDFKPGDWIEKENVGEQLTFDQITQMGKSVDHYGYEHCVPRVV